jgi:hypothetical protein
LVALLAGLISTASPTSSWIFMNWISALCQSVFRIMVYLHDCTLSHRCLCRVLLEWPIIFRSGVVSV